ncbi:hypothetical protein IJJ12_03615 [bacterium]|nr:hypothetical protein [bacterium]
MFDVFACGQLETVAEVIRSRQQNPAIRLEVGTRERILFEDLDTVVADMEKWDGWYQLDWGYATQPVNLEEAKDEFLAAFKSAGYQVTAEMAEPRFEYRLLEFDMEEASRVLSVWIDRVNDLVKRGAKLSRYGAIGCKMVMNRLVDAVNQLAALTAWQNGDADGVRLCQDRLYGPITAQLSELVKRAQLARLGQRTDPEVNPLASQERPRFSAEELAQLDVPCLDAQAVRKALEYGLRYHGLDERWHVIVSDQVQMVETRAISVWGPCVIVVPERFNRTRRSLREVCELLVYHINGQVLQLESGEALFGLGGVLVPVNQMFAEGLALQRIEQFRRDVFGEPETLPPARDVQALRVIAQGEPFSRVFDHLFAVDRLVAGKEVDLGRLAEETFVRTTRLYQGGYNAQVLGATAGYICQHQLAEYNLDWLSSLAVWEPRTAAIAGQIRLTPGLALTELVPAGNDPELPFMWLADSFMMAVGREKKGRWQ